MGSSWGPLTTEQEIDRDTKEGHGQRLVLFVRPTISEMVEDAILKHEVAYHNRDIAAEKREQHDAAVQREIETLETKLQNLKAKLQQEDSK